MLDSTEPCVCVVTANASVNEGFWLMINVRWYREGKSYVPRDLYGAVCYIGSDIEYRAVNVYTYI